MCAIFPPRHSAKKRHGTKNWQNPGISVPKNCFIFSNVNNAVSNDLALYAALFTALQFLCFGEWYRGVRL